MKKSKFIVFILSFLPGLSHLYTGYKERAIVFFISFFGIIGGVVVLSSITNSHDLFPVLLIVLPIIWFVSLVDALFLVDKIKRVPVEEGGSGQSCISQGIIDFNNKKLIAVTLSLIPGAGHMYLGLQLQGLQYMSLFFFTAFLMGWLNMSLFFFVLPVIWFYSLFDAYHRAEGDRLNKWEDNLLFINWFKEHPKWVGWGCIILGVVVVIERLITPLLIWEVRNYLQTGLVAVVLIVVGIKLIIGSKKNEADVEEMEGQEECEIVE